MLLSVDTTETSPPNRENTIFEAMSADVTDFDMKQYVDKMQRAANKPYHADKECYHCGKKGHLKTDRVLKNMEVAARQSSHLSAGM